MVTTLLLLAYMAQLPFQDAYTIYLPAFAVGQLLGDEDLTKEAVAILTGIRECDLILGWRGSWVVERLSELLATRNPFTVERGEVWEAFILAIFPPLSFLKGGMRG